MKPGDIVTTKNYGNAAILHIENCDNIYVKFDNTGTILPFKAGNVRKGQIKDPFKPSVYGKGFIGVGNYKSRENYKQTKAHRCWEGMIRRCYDPLALKKKPFYSGVKVCNEWLNFQVFAKWFHETHPGDGNDYHLDKDIKSSKKGKVYSPSTCLWLTPKENCGAPNVGTYKMIDSKGIVHNIENMQEFCKDKGLTASHMCSVHRGIRKSHKGWKKA